MRKRAAFRGSLLTVTLLTLSGCAGSESLHPPTERVEVRSTSFRAGEPGWSELPAPPANPSGQLVWAEDRVFLTAGAELGKRPGLWFLRPQDKSWTDAGRLPFKRPVLHPNMVTADGTLLLAGTTCDGQFDEEKGCSGTARFEIARYDLRSEHWSSPHVVDSVFDDESVIKKGVGSVALLGYARGEAQILQTDAAHARPVRHVEPATGRFVSDEPFPYTPGDSSCFLGDTRVDLVAGVDDLARPVDGLDSSGVTAGPDVRLNNLSRTPTLLSHVIRAGPHRAHLACDTDRAGVFTSSGEGAPPVVIDRDGRIESPAALKPVRGAPVSSNPILVISEDPADQRARVVSDDFESVTEVPGSEFFNAVGTGDGVATIGVGADNKVRAFFLDPVGATASSAQLPSEVMSPARPRGK